MRRILRRAFQALAVLLALLVVLAVILGKPYVEVATAYAAKIACSAIFVAERDPAEVTKVDLWFLPWVTVEVDRADRSVTARAGPISRKALHREGLGSVLVLPDGPPEAELRAQALPVRSPETIAALAARPWPLGDAGIDPTATALAHGFDAAKLARAVDGAFEEPDPAKPTMLTRALVVLHEGEVVAERYAPGFGPETRLIGWSMSKSVLHALLGVRAGDGKLSLAQKGLLPSWRAEGDAKAEITLDQMLRMSPGISFVEKYHYPWADALIMLFRSPDTAAYAASLPMAAAPDGAWNYSSGTTNILSRVLRSTFEGDGGDAAYLRFPRERLYDRIGMRSAVAETDPAGTFVLSSFSYATARDWARFGLLYEGDGVFAGERILPPGWVAHARAPTAQAPKGRYGAHFWLNAGAKDDVKDRPMPNVPADLYFAGGFQEQHVVVIPSKRLVWVRLGLTMPPTFVNEGKLAAALIDALPPGRP